jgi:DNA-binding beta-propeller fold protein YncE
MSTKTRWTKGLLGGGAFLAVILGLQYPSAARTISGPSVTPCFQIKNTENMQGLAYAKGYFYVGFDLGNGEGRIQEYSPSGRLVKDSGPLPISHAASITWNRQNGLLYVTNGGGNNPTKIYLVDFRPKRPRVVATIDLSRLGNSGLAAIDNARHMMWVHTAKDDHSDITFSYCSLTGKVVRQFKLKNQGVPQGLDVYNHELYYYTDNRITVLNESGKILRTIPLHESGESEGLAVVTTKAPYLVIGYNHPNRFYAVKGIL